MFLKALYLQNFRRYEEVLFEFSPDVNVIHGKNAVGKTTILEAISLLITGRSFRTVNHADLMRQGASSFTIEALIVKNSVEQKLRFYFSPKEKRVTINHTSYPSTAALMGILNGVTIHPDDVDIVKGAPSERRRLLDLHLAQSNPAYMHHLTRYHQAMRQRNALLKQKSSAAITTWEHEMALAASYIVPARAKAVTALEIKGRQIYREISGGLGDLSLDYKAYGAGDNKNRQQSELYTLYFEQFKRHRTREFELGATLSGPHKDDVCIAIGSQEARAYASEGQQRSCAVAMRLAEWGLLSAAGSESPLMLIDDFGIGLDITRQNKLIEYFSGLNQVFLTTTASEKVTGRENSIEIL